MQTYDQDLQEADGECWVPLEASVEVWNPLEDGLAWGMSWTWVLAAIWEQLPFTLHVKNGHFW